MYTITVPTEVYNGRTGKWIVGVRQLDPEDHDKYGTDNPLTTVAPLTGRLTTNYSIRSWTATCAYMEPRSWQQEVAGRDPEWLSNGLTVRCGSTFAANILSTFISRK